MATPPHPDDPMYSLEVSLVEWMRAARWSKEKHISYFRTSRLLTPVVRQLKLCEELKAIARGELKPPVPLAGYDYAIALRGKDEPEAKCNLALYAQALKEEFEMEDKLKREWIEYRKANPGCKNFSEHTHKLHRLTKMSEEFAKAFEEENKAEAPGSSSSSSRPTSESLGASAKAKGSAVFGRPVFANQQMLDGRPLLL